MTNEQQLSLKQAAQLFEGLFPNEAERRSLIQCIGLTARKSNALMPNTWGITLKEDHFRMNLGQVEVFIGGKIEGAAGFRLLLDEEDELVAPLAKKSGRPLERHRTAPGCVIVHLRPAGFGPLYQKLCRAHFEALGFVNKRSGYSWQDAHEPGFVRYLNAQGEDVPQPKYVGQR